MTLTGIILQVYQLKLLIKINDKIISLAKEFTVK